MRTILAVFAGLFSFSVVADDGVDWCSYQVPPVEMQTEPTVRYQVQKVDALDLDWLCGWAWAPPGTGSGCAQLMEPDQNGNRIAYIFLRNDLKPEQESCLLTHEKAHLPPHNWDHGPFWAARYTDGRWRPMPGPLYRRPHTVAGP